MTGQLSITVKELVENQVTWLIENRYSELDGIRIEYAPVTKEVDTVFFETNIRKSSLWRSRSRRTYQIFANESLGVDRPSDLACRSILAHELSHLLDYINLSLFGLIKLRIKISNEVNQRDYERNTDLHCLKRGFGKGLIKYREWIYGKIADPVKIAKKKYIYMTPEEIKLWLLENEE